MLKQGQEALVMKETVSDIITKLKKVRAENGLTYDRIADLVEQNGQHVSMSTIRRVFEEGSENYGWQFEHTLKPIADAVLGVYALSPETEGEADGETVDALRAIVRLKNEMITELAARLHRCEESYKRRIEFMKEQVTLKDARMDRKDDLIEKLIDAALNRPNCPHYTRCGSEKHIKTLKPKR